MTSLVIINSITDTIGWSPVQHFISLASRLYEAPVIIANKESVTSVRKTLSILKQRSRHKDKPDALMFLPSMADIWALYDIPNWQELFNQIHIFVVDSFQTEFIPKYFNHNHIDSVFIMTANDQKEYEKKVHHNTHYIAWGSDVLTLGGSSAERDIDVLRLGRQPTTWENDEKNHQYFKQHNIKYHGRPENPSSIQQNSSLLASYFKRSKYVLAHSNLVDRTAYTHKQKEYITARWCDALACGCVVAGVQPKSDVTYQEFLWPEATLEFESVEVDYGLQAIQHALNNWTPKLAANNYLSALERLDWRWRLQKIAGTLKQDFPLLKSDISQLQNQITETRNAELFEK